MTSSGNLYINGAPVDVSSSRILKTDIKEFEGYDQSLEDVMGTSLFTYKYKASEEFPEKIR